MNLIRDKLSSFTVHVRVYLEMPPKSLSVSPSPLYREGGGEGAPEPKLLQCRFVGSRAVLMHPSSLLFWGGWGGEGDSQSRNQVNFHVR